MPTVIIIEKGNTRLGNKLLIFASVYAWCLESGFSLWNPSFWRYADAWPRFSGDLMVSPNQPFRIGRTLSGVLGGRRICCSALRRIRRMGLGQDVRPPGGKSFVDLPPSGDLSTPCSSLYFITKFCVRNPVGLVRHGARIRELFQIGPQRSASAGRFFAQLASPKRPRIAVHIRMTDYRHHFGGAFYLALDAYKKAMSETLTLLRARGTPPPLFAIFSDENRDESEFPEFDAFVSRGTTIEDMDRLSLMDGIIGPASTFSSWAAYFGQRPLLQLGASGQQQGVAWIWEGQGAERDVGAFADAVAAQFDRRQQTSNSP